MYTTILPATPVSLTPCCHSLPLGAWTFGSGTTFSWLQDVLFTHVYGVVFFEYNTYNTIKIAVWRGGTQTAGSMAHHQCTVYCVQSVALS